MFLRIVVRLKVCGERLQIVVRLILRVFLQRYMDCLEKKCAWMIGDFEYLLVFLDVLVMLSVGTVVVVVD